MFIAVLERELAWQASLQAANGALPMYAGKEGAFTRVCPYFSCYAALSLLLRPMQYAGQVRRYLDWHIRHLNAAEKDVNGLDGSIYDYRIAHTKEGRVAEQVLTDKSGKMAYDSTDSYAALFLILADAYQRTSGDAGYVYENRQAIGRVYAALCATLHKGLSFAKPDWRVQYLMDNCEAAWGFSAAARLFGTLHGLTGGASGYRTMASESLARERIVTRTIEETLWNARRGHYLVGRNANGSPVPAILRMQRYYPDAMAQLFPIITGALPPQSARAKRIYENFCHFHSNRSRRWEDMEGENKAEPSVGGIIVRAAAMMEDRARLARYMEHYERNILDAGHPGCYNADCAHVAAAAGMMAGHICGRDS